MSAIQDQELHRVDRMRYPKFDEYVIGADSELNSALTVRGCNDCGAVVHDTVKHDAYHDLLSRMSINNQRAAH